MYSIGLHYVPEISRIYLRDLCGVDELDVRSSKSEDAIRLINRLLVKNVNGQLANARLLPVAERDFLLAGIYQRIFGDRIESTVRCQKCNEPFDIDFNLSELVNHLWDGKTTFVDRLLSDGSFQMKDGFHFRLPTGEDEYAVMNLSPENAKAALLKKCLYADPTADSLMKLEEMMDKVAPLVETNLNGVCPECNTSQEIFFSIQHFLLNALLNEKKQTLREIHRIAMSYKWSHSEIINLPRTVRKTYVSFIEKEMDYT
ncbi:MAG: hypothetical protein MI974_05040 [Chitinophagales bacterium]|nr:hypothetical protein [Chitinophagales bacterium]